VETSGGNENKGRKKSRERVETTEDMEEKKRKK